MANFSVILAAAGQSRRFKDPNFKKPFASLNRKAVWLYSADLFLKRPDVKQLIIVISQDEKEDFFAKFGPNLAVLGIEVVLGGKELRGLGREGAQSSQSELRFCGNP